MLSLAVALKRFEPVAWRLTQIIQRAGTIQQHKLAARLPLDGTEARYVLVREQARRRRVPEGADH